MQGDFTRDTFDPLRRFSRVLMQQGRVQLDADWNEQVAILLHYVQTLAKDIIGPYGKPGGHFVISRMLDPNVKNDFVIGAGHYYVDGILCELDSNTTYLQQADYPMPDPLQNGQYLAYLDMWERHISYLEDEGDLNIREVALGVGGPDTATRAKVVWQVKLWKTDTPSQEPFDKDLPPRLSQVYLRARANQEQPLSDPCVMQPDARYRGAENQLYRVEIHTGGTMGTAIPPTFKWSRENASVMYPAISIQSDTAMLASLGRDKHLSLMVGDWVEIVYHERTLRGEPGPLVQVGEIDSTHMKVTLKSTVETLPGHVSNSTKPLLLRRWDYQERGEGTPTLNGMPFKLETDHAVKIVESKGEKTEDWFVLEDGVQIQFQTPQPGQNHVYRTGDYWLIPARTVTGDVEWPQEQEQNGMSPKGTAKAMQPHGVEHHYAPLAGIIVSPENIEIKDLFPQDILLATGNP